MFLSEQTVWDAAITAGYRVHLLDAQYNGKGHNYFTQTELERVNVIPAQGLRSDAELIPLIEAAVAAAPEARHFFYINKVGSHFPYYRANIETPFTPTMSNAKLADFSPLEVRNAYKNLIVHNTDQFFDALAGFMVRHPDSFILYTADHGQTFPADPSHRMFAPELGGGALLDLGVYPISFAQMVLGDLGDLAVRGALTETAVDAYFALLGTGAGGGHARLSSTLLSRTPTQAVVSGTAGAARLSGPFFAPSTLTVTLHDGRSAVYEHPADRGDGMAYEIAEAARRITAGELESPLMSWQDTLSVMTTMDAVRAELGVVYPGEESA